MTFSQTLKNVSLGSGSNFLDLYADQLSATNCDAPRVRHARSSDCNYSHRRDNYGGVSDARQSVIHVDAEVLTEGSSWPPARSTRRASTSSSIV